MHWNKLAFLLAMTSGMAWAQSDTVYAPPIPVAPDEGTNQGGVSFELNIRNLTDYVYRGVDYTEVVNPETDTTGGENNLDLNVDAMMRFDLGDRVPHPFMGVAANVYDSDPESRFQEFRPIVGADLTLQPLIFTAALQSYTYPQRDQLDTSEVLGKVQLDDSRIFGSDVPLLNPYILVAYDYDLNNGFYAEAGISHDFLIEDISVTITPIARIAYTRGWQQQFAFFADDGSGWQHLDLGAHVQYKLNSLLNLSRRWGDWYLRGQLFYTEHLASSTVGHTLTYGGLGIGFEY